MIAFLLCKYHVLEVYNCSRHRHIFLFDLAVIVCKRRGDNYEMKDIIDLQEYKIMNNPTTDKENKKVNMSDDFVGFSSI